MTELEKLRAGLEYCYDEEEVDALKEQAIGSMRASRRQIRNPKTRGLPWPRRTGSIDRPETEI